MDETRLRALLNQAVSAEPPTEQPLGRIEANSRRGGRRLRRRRRGEGAAATVASVAAVAATVSVASGVLSHYPADHAGRSRQMAYVLTLSGAVVPVNLATMRAGRPLQTGLKGFGTVPANSDAVVAPGGRTLYVSTKGGKILRISASTGKISRTIGVAGIPIQADQLLAGPNGKIAYAPDFGTTITPVDLVTGRALKPIAVSNAAEAAGFVAVSRNDKTLLTAGLRAVTVVTSGRAHPPIKLRGPLSATCLAVSSNGAWGYLLRRSPKGHYNVLPIDVATNKSLKPIWLQKRNYGVRTGLCGLALAPNGQMAYVQIGRYVAPINLVTGKALKPIQLWGVSADFTPQLTVDPDGRMAYALGAHWVFPINLATDKALPAVSLSADFDGYSLAFNPDGTTALVGVGGAHNTGRLLLIHAATGKLFKSIGIAGVPASIAVWP
jgi:hypothetical protein